MNTTYPTFIGKLIGACLGYLTLGPFGMLFGLFIGNIFDKGLMKQFNKPYQAYRQEHRKQQKETFLYTLFATLGFLAKSAGQVSKQDIAYAKTLMDAFELSADQKHTYQAAFSFGKTSAFELPSALVRFKTICYDNKPLIELFLELQYHAAQGGLMNDKKNEALHEIFSLLNYAPPQQQSQFYNHFYEEFAAFRQQQYQQYQRQHSKPQQPKQTTVAQAYQLLNVSKDATLSEVKKAYRRLMSQYHPDKLQATGASAQAMKEATEKTQAIRSAYECICAHKGW